MVVLSRYVRDAPVTQNVDTASSPVEPLSEGLTRGTHGSAVCQPYAPVEGSTCRTAAWTAEPLIVVLLAAM